LASSFDYTGADAREIIHRITEAAASSSIIQAVFAYDAADWLQDNDAGFPDKVSNAVQNIASTVLANMTVDYDNCDNYCLIASMDATSTKAALLAIQWSQYMLKEADLKHHHKDIKRLEDVSWYLAQSDTAPDIDMDDFENEMSSSSSHDSDVSRSHNKDQEKLAGVYPSALTPSALINEFFRIDRCAGIVARDLSQPEVRNAAEAICIDKVRDFFTRFLRAAKETLKWSKLRSIIRGEWGRFPAGVGDEHWDSSSSDSSSPGSSDPGSGTSSQSGESDLSSSDSSSFVPDGRKGLKELVKDLAHKIKGKPPQGESSRLLTEEEYEELTRSPSEQSPPDGTNLRPQDYRPDSRPTHDDVSEMDPLPDPAHPPSGTPPRTVAPPPGVSEVYTGIHDEFQEHVIRLDPTSEAEVLAKYELPTDRPFGAFRLLVEPRGRLDRGGEIVVRDLKEYLNTGYLAEEDPNNPGWFTKVSKEEMQQYPPSPKPSSVHSTVEYHDDSGPTATPAPDVHHTTHQSQQHHTTSHEPHIPATTLRTSTKSTKTTTSQTPTHTLMNGLKHHYRNIDKLTEMDKDDRKKCDHKISKFGYEDNAAWVKETFHHGCRAGQGDFDLEVSYDCHLLIQELPHREQNAWISGMLPAKCDKHYGHHVGHKDKKACKALREKLEDVIKGKAGVSVDKNGMPPNVDCKVIAPETESKDGTCTIGIEHPMDIDCLGDYQALGSMDKKQRKHCDKQISKLTPSEMYLWTTIVVPETCQIQPTAWDSDKKKDRELNKDCEKMVEELSEEAREAWLTGVMQSAGCPRHSKERKALSKGIRKRCQKVEKELKHVVHVKRGPPHVCMMAVCASKEVVTSANSTTSP
jgi:hypothetical protein